MWKTHLHAAFCVVIIDIVGLRGRPRHAVALRDLREVRVDEGRRRGRHVQFPGNLSYIERCAARQRRLHGRGQKGGPYPLADDTIVVLHHRGGKLAAVFVHEDVPEDVQLCDRAQIPASSTSRACPLSRGHRLTLQFRPRCGVDDCAHALADPGIRLAGAAGWLRKGDVCNWFAECGTSTHFWSRRPNRAMRSSQ